MKINMLFVNQLQEIINNKPLQPIPIEVILMITTTTKENGTSSNTKHGAGMNTGVTVDHDRNYPTSKSAFNSYENKPKANYSSNKSSNLYSGHMSPEVEREMVTQTSSKRVHVTYI